VPIDYSEYDFPLLYAPSSTKMSATPCNNNNHSNGSSKQLGKDNGTKYVILVEFAHKHLDFQLPELSSVLEMNGISLVVMNDDHDDKTTTPGTSINNSKSNTTMTTCRMLPLPNQERYRQEAKAAARRAFVILEMDSSWSRRATTTDTMTISSILSRCVLVRRIIELWGTKPGTTIEETAQNVQQWIQQPKEENQLGHTLHDNSCNPPTQTWKITIHTLGAKYTRQEQDAMRLQFAFLQLPGKVQMKQPDHEFILIREMELDPTGNPLYPRHGLHGTMNKENDTRLPLAAYFGRVLWSRDKNSMEQYDLKKRAYLGPTSMDAELSFVMANLGQVQKGTVVLDPFVGTGSILVSCALRGAYCVGTDIDIRVLRGKNDGNIYSNFSQFQLPRPEVIRSDNAIYHRHFRSSEPWVDTIITDPPYGIRAGARKSGSRLDQPRPVLEENRHDHIAQTRPYNVADVMADLLDVAARVLVMGGRLVYVIPSFASDFDISKDLPQHDCLELVHLSFQPFTLELGRRMVTMRKIKAYDPMQREIYLATTWRNGPASAEKCANIRDKILEAAKLKPGYEEKARVRKQKRKVHKEARKKAKLEHKQQESSEA
jgi:tRNA (guanine10-N2)-methyltransferase